MGNYWIGRRRSVRNWAGRAPLSPQNFIRMIFALWSLGDRPSPGLRIGANAGLTGLVSDPDWPNWDHLIGFASGSVGLEFSPDWRIGACGLA